MFNKIIRTAKSVFRRLSLPARFLIFFAALILFGAILLVLPFAASSGKSCGFSAALFASASAVCGCGLKTVSTAEYWSEYGKAVILLLIQTGGLAVMLMGTVFLLKAKHKITAARKGEPVHFNADGIQGFKVLIKYLLIFVFSAETAGALLLLGVFIPVYGAGRGIYMSFYHAVSAFCNSGFDIIGDSFPAFSTNLLFASAMSLMIFAGGIGFGVLADIVSKRRFKRFEINTKFVLASNLLLTAGGALIIFILEFSNNQTLGEMNLLSRIVVSVFSSVSARTGGFAVFSLSALKPASFLFYLLLMSAGASAGSAGGGIKIPYVSLLGMSAWQQIRGRKRVFLGGRTVSSSSLIKASSVLTIYLLAYAVFTILLVTAEDITLKSAAAEILSAVSSGGLSTGVTARLGLMGKLTVILAMYTGKIGLTCLIFSGEISGGKNRNDDSGSEYQILTVPG